jgi:hypothetical protein
MSAPVIHGFNPGLEQSVEGEQVAGRFTRVMTEQFVPGDFDDELFLDRSKEALDFASALRATRGGMDQLDAQFRARPQQPRIDKS